jgi:hypothetical protein
VGIDYLDLASNLVGPRRKIDYEAFHQTTQVKRHDRQPKQAQQKMSTADTLVAAAQRLQSYTCMLRPKRRRINWNAIMEQTQSHSKQYESSAATNRLADWERGRKVKLDQNLKLRRSKAESEYGNWAKIVHR